MLSRRSVAGRGVASAALPSAGPCLPPRTLARPARPLLPLRHAAAPSLPSAARPRPLCVATRAATTNPAFTMGRLDEAVAESGYGGGRGGEVMTADGAVQKTALLLAVAMATACATWAQILSGNAAAALGAAKMAGIVALGSSLVTMFKPQASMFTGLLFSASQGVAMAGMSLFLEMRYPGLVLNALMLTVGTAASLLAAYQTRIIKVTDRFRDGVIMVTGGYMITMLFTFVLSLCGVRLPGLLSAGPIGIGVGLVAAGLAAANLLLDFDMIRSAARQRLPKWFEWYGAFSLMLTLVWMYTTIVRLLTMFAGGRDD
ncbi:hypothetical protein HYH03_016482 [Edaphochlamys debaryana]|uniref:Uncharacterized protein n=1 Tax=Edaphochlamys debaryana TaxID=47281 RepID=A0A836BQ41_9CHLO|nr:hypothetical protein HYH03_016482 [Edaphochlamys debaryana]|eukprot:KAG2484735.1 hypothetical protein HYH03_016482 [Edaphochlamys debaryana]